jgi:hypothetical protein
MHILMPEGQLKHPPACVEIAAAKIHWINDFPRCRSLGQITPAVKCCAVRPPPPGCHNNVIARDNARVNGLRPPSGILHNPKVEAAPCFSYYHLRPVHNNVKDRLLILGSNFGFEYVARTVVARARNIVIAQKALFTDSLLSEEWLHGAGYFHQRCALPPQSFVRRVDFCRLHPCGYRWSPNRVRTLFTSVRNEADRVGPT